MIIHFTTVHPREILRIRSKELASLARAFDSQVALYVQDGLGTRSIPGTAIALSTPAREFHRGRHRVFVGGWRMFRAVARRCPGRALSRPRTASLGAAPSVLGNPGRL